MVVPIAQGSLNEKSAEYETDMQVFLYLQDLLSILSDSTGNLWLCRSRICAPCKNFKRSPGVTAIFCSLQKYCYSAECR